jgi:superfamily I DNA/RNA helicase
VKVAQQWVSHITAAETAPEGETRTIEERDLFAAGLDRADAILCRNNKPLVELAFRLIRSGVACHVEGRDIGANLITLINRWKRVRSIVELTRRLEEYQERETEKALARGREMRAQAIEDAVQTVLVIVEEMPAGSTLDDLRAKISSMFIDTKTGELAQTLTLATIHKAKGREWDRVFWLGRNLYQPSRFARQSWQQEQERNLMYVAATRAKQALIEVNVTEKQKSRRSAA